MKVYSIKKKITWTVVASIFLLAGMFALFQQNVEKIYTMMLEKDMEQIEDTSDFVTKLIYSEIESIMFSLQSDQIVFLEVDGNDTEDIIRQLRKIKSSHQFESVGVVDLEGRGMDEDGRLGRIQDQAFLESISENKSYISNVDEVSDTMLLAVPIVQEQEVKGAVWGHYSVSRIAEKIELSKDSSRYFQIIDDEGIYISDSGNVNSLVEKKNIWEELKRYHLEDGVTVEQIRSDVRQGKSGSYHFRYDDTGRYVTYQPLEIRNWYVFSILVEEELSEYVDEIGKVFSHILGVVAGAMFLIVGIVMFFVLQDLYSNKEQNARLLAKNKLLFLVLQKTSDIPFEIDLLNQTLSVYKVGASEEMTCTSLQEMNPEKMVESGKIQEKDKETYRQFYHCVASNQTAEPIVMKLNIGGMWKYNRIHVKRINENYMIGFLENYDEQSMQKKKIKLISSKLQNDSLTGLYSREYFIQKVEEFLHHEEFASYEKYAALFLLDLDSFKLINDTFGHGMGDTVLKDVGRKLREIIREGDIVGRLGGDEFIVFVRNVKDLEGLHNCAMRMNQVLRDTYSEGEHQVAVSASVGVAVWTGETSFDELYKLADQELYKVKKNGKNNYAMSVDFTQI